jgi:hypothetical protein
MILGLVPHRHLITHPRSPIEQLKNRWAVNVPGHHRARIKLTLRKLGIDPDKEVKLVPRGGNPERLAAISQGIAQFTHMPEPFIREADKLGLRDFIDIGSLKIPFHWNASMTRETPSNQIGPSSPATSEQWSSRFNLSRPTKKPPKRFSQKNFEPMIRMDSKGPIKPIA